MIDDHAMPRYLLRRLGTARDQLTTELGRQPTPEELAKRAGVSRRLSGLFLGR